MGQESIAVTDHGSMSSVLPLFHECTKWNKENPGKEIKPIFGMEAYIVADRTKKKPKKNKKEMTEEELVQYKDEFANRHLLLLARNQQGYKNLLKLHYEGYATGGTFVYDRLVPRIDHTLLTPTSCKGIIATTGCIAGEVCQFLLTDRWDEALQLTEKYKKLFDHFFIELQPPHLIDDQAEVNDKLVKLAELADLPIICTTDSHYLTPGDREAHQLILAIQSKKDIEDPDRFTFEASHLMSADEMLEYFDQSVLENTQKVADLCEYPHFLKFDTHGYRLPKYPIPEDREYEEWREQGRCEGEDESQTFCRYLVEKSWARKLRSTQDDPALEKKYRDRLKTEMDVIANMGFVDYFLIVWDFVDWCKQNGIMTGCGRGSAGGCLLSYLLGITKLDPIKYDLLFSRFLNADRVSLPDIDMDIDKARRDEVKEYLAQKYGRDRVASIATFSTMKVRACVKDIVRSLKKGGDKKASFEIADRINKTLEDQPDDVKYAEAIDTSEEFAKYMEEYPDVAMYAREFEGLVRQTGIHAAGVIIGSEPLTDTIPLMVDKNGVVATAYDGTTLEKDGFLKIDLLGLKNLTIITETLKNIEKVRGYKFKGFYTKGVDVFLDEPDETFNRRVEAASQGKQMASRAYKLLRDGKTNGVFQVEGQGMRGLLKSVYVNSIEEVAAVLALNRPGPLKAGMTAEYGKRKRMGGDRDEWYLHPSLKPVLQRSYGVLVYQEQVMRIAVDCAGFTEAEADTLRKAMGKKIESLLKSFEKKFIDGCQQVAGMSEVIAEKLYEEILGFAAYGFNRSHAVGYAHTTYECSYLKANYPAEYFGALLSNEANQEKLNTYLREAQNQGIRIKPVNINKSTMRYEVEDVHTIRRDLSSLKNVGAAAVVDILAKRPFKSMVDFLARTDSKKVTARVIEALIKAGAFENAFEEENVTRKTYYDFYDDCRKKIKRFIKRQREKEEQYLPEEYQGKQARIKITNMTPLHYLVLTGKTLASTEELVEEFPQYDWDGPTNVRPKGRGKNRTMVETPVARYSKDPRTEWNPSEIVAFETEIYGAPVTYNIFDFHEKAEKSFKAKCNPIYYFDDSLDSYEHGDKIYMMVVVKGIIFKKAYNKDANKAKKRYTRRYVVEDRTGEGILTVFDKCFANNPNAWNSGNTLILECQANVFMNRKSIVVERVVHNCGSIDGSV